METNREKNLILNQDKNNLKESCYLCGKNSERLAEKRYGSCKECKERKQRCRERKCRRCGKKYTAILLKENNPSTRNCDDCFKNKKKIKGINSRPSINFAQCDLCGATFDKKILIYVHMEKHRGDTTCRVCNASFSRRNTLRMHLRTHFENFICEQCGYSTTNKITFRHHIKLHTEINVNGKNTQKSTYVKGKYPAVRGNFPCSHCGLVFVTKTTLIGHEKRQHENGNKGFTCKDCKITIFRQKEFREHMMTHSNKPLLFCHYPNCDYYYNTIKRMNMHIKYVHETKDDSYECQNCKKTFKHRMSLEKHQRNNRCIPLSVRKLNGAKKNVSKSTKYFENKTAEELERNAKIAKQQYLEIRGLSKIIEKENEEKNDDIFKEDKNQIKLVFPKIESISDNDDSASLHENEYFEQDTKSNNALDNTNIQPFLKIEIKSEPVDNGSIVIENIYNEKVSNMCTNIIPINNRYPLVHLERLDNAMLQSISKIKKEEKDDLDFSLNISPEKKQIKVKKKKVKRRKSKDRVYSCKFCLEIFVHKKTLKEHEKCFHKTEVKKSLTEIYTCDMCAKQFKSYMSLKVHIKFVHLSTIDYSCPHCPSKYKTKNFLKRHIEESHIGIKRFSCQFCGKEFKRKEHLQDHESRHAEPVTCHICGKLVKKLEQHVKNIHKEKREFKTFPCSYCGKFFNKYILKSHINNVHNKLHVCLKCGENFTTPTDLKMHELMNHFEGKYSINYCHYNGCNKMFKSVKLLNMHMRIHENREKVSCENCGKTFQSTSGLKKHALKKHNLLL